MDRVDKVFAFADRSGRGLEFGPSYRPLAPKSAGFDVVTVDHTTREELVKKYRAYERTQEQLDAIEEVDLIWDGGSFADLVDEKFDFIIASHFIEHTVDMIGFLQDCERMLKPGGVLTLVVPDKRFCFDMFQPLTTVGDVIDGHLSDLQYHPAGAVVDHFAYTSTRGGTGAWGPKSRAPIKLNETDLAPSTYKVERGSEQAEYIDVHRWKFTPSSFTLLMQDLRDLGYLQMAEAGGFGTTGCEFFVTLTTDARKIERRDRFELLLKTEFELRSVRIPELDSLDINPNPQTTRIARLQKKVAQLKEENRELKRSTSWRVTKPIRKASKAAKSARIRVSG